MCPVQCLLVATQISVHFSSTMTGGDSNVEQWDLISRISPYLDRHLMFPLLEYVDSLIVNSPPQVRYKSTDVSAARLALLRPTHMVDYAIDVYKSIHGEATQIPSEMMKQRDEVIQQLEALKSACQPLLDLCSKTEEKVCKLSGLQRVLVSVLPLTFTK
jgi:translation initiation factor 3 subunit E